MKRGGTILPFILWILAAFVLAPAPVSAQAGGAPDPTAVYWDEGRDPILFQVTCTSTSWTVVVASDTARRSAVIQAPPDNDTNICLSTSTAGTCTGVTTGVELAAKDSLTDYTRIAWRCRARANAAASMTANLKGYVSRDRADYGKIERP